MDEKNQMAINLYRLKDKIKSHIQNEDKRRSITGFIRDAISEKLDRENNKLGVRNDNSKTF